MLSNDAIVQGLNTLVGPTLGHAAARMGFGLPRLFACWEAPAGYAVCKYLPAATWALNYVVGRFDFDLAALSVAGVPDAWLPMTLEGPVSAWGDGSADPLVGVGLVAAPSAAVEHDEARTAWMALTGGSALRWEGTCDPSAIDAGSLAKSVTHNACDRIETGTSLWWDAAGLLDPLECLRAAISGWPPVLPDSVSRPAPAFPTSTGWAGPR